MDHPPKAPEPEAEAKAKAFAAAVPNGALRKHRPLPPPEAAVDLLYRECLKNHAASLGGHALDGCGEFLLSPAADPADPTSLRCAACGCHRNFHRRHLDPLHRHHRPEGEDERDGTEDDDEDDVDDEENDGGRPRPQRSSPSPPLFYSSAPHMLLALSAGLPGGLPPAPAPALVRPAVEAAAAPQPRKRFRTKFSPEQKRRMQELSERLGWRMQKRDEGLVDECCREIGVDKGVFKVWMHNNKHTFFGLARRGDATAAAAAARNGGSVGAGGQTEEASHHRANGGDGGGDDGDGGNGHVVNGSFSPS